MNTAGSVVFGNIVSGLIDKEVGSKLGFDVRSYTRPNGTIEGDVEGGIYILPSGFGALPNNTLPV